MEKNIFKKGLNLRQIIYIFLHDILPFETDRMSSSWNITFQEMVKIYNIAVSTKNDNIINKALNSKKFITLLTNLWWDEDRLWSTWQKALYEIYDLYNIK